MSVTARPFGVTLSGENVTAYRLENKAGVSAEILDYGCTLRALTVPAKDGAVDVCLGYDTLAEYEESDGCLGAVVGRYANRIAGGRFALNGTTYSLACNDGAHHLHGGARGFDRYVWSAALLEDGVAFSRLSPNREEGYPGTLAATVTYRLTGGNALVIDYRAQSDADTVLNLTNHAYFDLSGGVEPMGQRLQICAVQFTEASVQCLPTGRILPVEGTPLDFRVSKPVGRDLDADYVHLRNVGGYDHNFILTDPDLDHAAARLSAPKTGVTMEVRTDLPGVQLYTANFLSPRRGKGGATYAPRCALCLETQFYPDSPNRPEFPSSVLRKGEVYHHVTEFQLGW